MKGINSDNLLYGPLQVTTTESGPLLYIYQLINKKKIAPHSNILKRNLSITNTLLMSCMFLYLTNLSITVPLGVSATAMYEPAERDATLRLVVLDDNI